VRNLLSQSTRFAGEISSEGVLIPDILLGATIRTSEDEFERLGRRAGIRALTL